MPADSAALLVQCQMALGLSQAGLGELLGMNRRTIQRWQDGGFVPTLGQSETLAQALEADHPELAGRVRDLGRTVALAAGISLPVRPAPADVIDAILLAAAAAGGTSPDSIRPALMAALAKAEEAGVDISAILAGLSSA